MFERQKLHLEMDLGVEGNTAEAYDEALHCIAQHIRAYPHHVQGIVNVRYGRAKYRIEDLNE